MAITVDNAVSRVQNEGGTSVTTGTFNTAAGDGLVVTANCDEAGNGGTCIHTLSDNQTPDLTYVSIAERSDDDSLQNGSVAAWYVVDAGAVTGLTITDSLSGTATPADPTVKVYKVTGHDTADMLGAQTENGSTTNDLTTASITPETSGVGFAVGTEWQQLGDPTSSDLSNLSTFNMAGDISGCSGYKNLTASSGATANLNAFGTGAAEWNYLWFEIRAASGGGGAVLQDPIGVGLVPFPR